jgi:hypothetical protein
MEDIAIEFVKALLHYLVFGLLAPIASRRWLEPQRPPATTGKKPARPSNSKER